ncbi:hypothetical protein GQ649_29565 [Rhodococcus sp. DSM 6344]|nr:hypothetical protein [Rhodococcus erythropolis]
MDDQHNQRRAAEKPVSGLTYEFASQTLADFRLAPGEPLPRRVRVIMGNQISEFATEDEMAELRRRANVFLDRDFALFDQIGEFVNDHDFSRIRAAAGRVGLTELHTRMTERTDRIFARMMVDFQKKLDDRHRAHLARKDC